MAGLSGTNLAAGIVPFTTEDSYPTHDALYGKGGYRSVSSIEERDSIPTDRRCEGMAVYVTSEKKCYILQSNGAWDVLSSGSSSGGSSSGVSDYNDLQNKPKIPSKTSELENDSGFIKEHQSLSGYVKDSALSAVAKSGAYSDLSGTPELSTVALTGSYNDLSDKPVIENKTYSKVATSGSYKDLKDAPVLHTVATSGSFNDLTDKPEFPEVKNYATVATSGSYNDLSDTPTIPSKTSQLQNDSNFLTQHQSLAGLASTGYVTQEIDKIKIPEKTSDLRNDSGFITEESLLESSVREMPVKRFENGYAQYSLVNNTVNAFDVNINTKFILPTPSNTNILNQIVVHFNMLTTYTIDFGTQRYFDKKVPDLSEAGSYTLIYEYDALYHDWYVGALKKGYV